MSSLNIGTRITRFCRMHRSVIIMGSLLLLLLSLGLYFRLHNLANWFSYFNDYDEGAYVLASRFINEGLIPYRDFNLFQPPLYNLMLAGLFKLFHYDFMLARYVSVAFSLVNVIFIFVIARRTFGLLPAAVAGAIFAFDPILLYLSRRAVLESFGLTLCLAGLLFLTFYLSNSRKWWLIGVGVAFGLTLSVKLTFLPLVAGVLMAVAFREAGFTWRWLARFGTTKALLEYLAVGGSIFAVLLLLNGNGWNLPIPPLDSIHGTRGAFVGFILLFVPVAVVLGLNVDYSAWKGLFSGAWRAIRSHAVLTLAAATVLTFGFVIGPFLLIDPQATFSQVFGSLVERPEGEVPSFLGIMHLAIISPGLLKYYALPVLATVPVLYLLLRSRTATPMHCITTIGLAISLVCLQMVFHVPRYYMAVWPFLALGAASFFTDTAGTLKTGKFIALGAVILLLCSLSLPVTYTNMGYDTLNDKVWPKGEAFYDEVAEFISTLKPNAKVYSGSPMLVALSPELETTSIYTTFGQLWVAKEKASDFVDRLQEKGVEFVVLDPWVRGWIGGGFGPPAEALQAEVRSRGNLIQVIGSEDQERFEVYALTREGEEDQAFFNGDFSYWLPNTLAPLGWEAISATNKENATSVKSLTVEGQQAVALLVRQTTTASPNDFTHVRIRQVISVPDGAIQLQVYPTFNYKDQDGLPLTVAGVEISDGKNPTIWYTFGELGGLSRSFDFPNGHHVEVLDAPLNRWSIQTINIKETYQKLGWSVPDKVSFDLFLAVHVSHPGSYSVFFGPIQAVIP